MTKQLKSDSNTLMYGNSKPLRCSTAVCATRLTALKSSSLTAVEELLEVRRLNMHYVEYSYLRKMKKFRRY